MERDDDLCVYISVPNSCYGPVCLKSGDVLGRVQPVEIKTPFDCVTNLFAGEKENCDVAHL